MLVQTVGSSASGKRAYDQIRLVTRRNGIRQRHVRQLVREILAARIEAEKRPAPVGRVVADRAPQHGIAGLDGVDDRPLRDLPLNIYRDLGAYAGQTAEMMRQLEPDHGLYFSVCTSTDTTAGRWLTIGVQLSPASADPYT